MALNDFLDTEEFSVQYAVQSDLNTPATTGWVGLDCTFPEITVEPVQTETVRATGAPGASTDVETGRRYYRIAFSAPLHGQPADYDFTTDEVDITETGVLHFFKWLRSSSDQVAYAANNVSSVDGNTINLATSGALDGALVAFGSGVAGTIRGQGFVQDGSTPATTHLFEDLAVVPQSNDERYPTCSIYPGPASNQPSPVTFRLLGSASRNDWRFAGCHVSKLTPREDGDNLYLDVELVAYAGMAKSSSGALEYPLDYLKLQPLLARGGARTVVGSNVIAALDDGSAGGGTCGLEDVTLSIEFPHEIVRCDEGIEGVEEVVVLAPKITGSLFCPNASSYEVDSENIFETAWREKTKLSITRYLGDRPGAGFCWKVGAAIITACDPGTSGRKWGWNVSWKAGAYRGDATSADAGNKPLVIGFP